MISNSVRRDRYLVLYVAATSNVALMRRLTRTGNNDTIEAFSSIRGGIVHIKIARFA
jgi:hypothetical protein